MIRRKGILLGPHQFEQEGAAKSSWPEPQEQSMRGWIKCCLGERFVRRQVGNGSEVDVKRTNSTGHCGWNYLCPARKPGDPLTDNLDFRFVGGRSLWARGFSGLLLFKN